MTAAAAVLVLGALAWVWGLRCGRGAGHLATVAEVGRLVGPVPATAVLLTVGHGVAAGLVLGLAAALSPGQGHRALLAVGLPAALTVALAVRAARRRTPWALVNARPGLVLGLVAEVRSRGDRRGPALGRRQVVGVGVVLGLPAAAPALAAALVLPGVLGVPAGAAGGTVAALAVLGALGTGTGTGTGPAGTVGEGSGVARTLSAPPSPRRRPRRPGGTASWRGSPAGDPR